MKFAFITVIALLVLTSASRDGWSADAPSMLDTASPQSSQQWHAIPVFTVGDRINGYTAPGSLDGIGAFTHRKDEVRILVNHELKANDAYSYKLANGTELTGARISFFDIRKEAKTHNFKFTNAGLAYDTIYDREAKPVSDSTQINEETHQAFNQQKGLSRFCSGRSVQAGASGFSDDIYFAGEETSTRRHPHGGTIWVLDVKNRILHAAPDLGRGAWENVTPIETGSQNTIALLMGDDTAPAPLYLYLGRISSGPEEDRNFLSRNGLSGGQLYCWKSNAGHISPETFNKTGNTSGGYFIPLYNRMPQQAGKDGYDRQGYPDSSTLCQSAINKGCFQFSRLEDLHNDPANPGRAVFADTGQGLLHPANDWGSIHIIDINFDHHADTKPRSFKAVISIAYDSDDINNQDEGIRSPDNLTWADNGMIYIQEDPTSQLNNFASNGVEASVWQLDPESLNVQRIAIIDRSIILPVGAVDELAGEIGTWETSGILDVTRYFNTLPAETLLLTAVQAHYVKGGAIIGGRNSLVESGQLIFLTNKRDQ
ncbi:MAG: alkaline phosphatase PhoX [Arenicellales bacterium]